MRISDWSSDVCSSDLAGVGVVGGVQRLVNVADEVDDELERVAAGLDRLALVGEDRPLLFDRADHAVAVRAVARGDVAAAAVGRGLDVVPFRGGLEARRVLVAQGVGPAGGAGGRTKV